MKNKTDIQTKNQQIDKILQEQYDARAEKTGSTGAAKEKLESLEYDGNRTHRILKSAAAAVAVVMLTALVGMTAIADYRYPDKNTQTYQKTSVFEKK